MKLWIIIFVALVLRLINVNQSLWLDEEKQVLLCKEQLRNIFWQRSVDVHPPLSYVLMHFWVVVNSSEIWLRLLSVIFGVLTVWVLYIFSSKIFSEKIALLSSFFLSISPYHIYYSQEVRMYSEAIFFATVSMYFFYLIFKKIYFPIYRQ